MNVSDAYKRLSNEEVLLVHQIQTYEGLLTHLLQRIEQYGDQLHVLTLEDVLSQIHTISSDCQLELFHLRLEKAIINYKIQSNKGYKESVQ